MTPADDHQETAKKNMSSHVDQKFRQLVEALSGGQGELVLQQSKLEELVPQLLKLLSWISLKKKVTKEDHSIVQNIFYLLSACFLFNEDTLTYFYNYVDETDPTITFSQLLIDGITCIRSQEIKDHFQNNLVYLSQQFTKVERVRLPLFEILNVVIKTFYAGFTDTTAFYSTVTFYRLFNQLLYCYFNMMKEGHPKFEELFDRKELIIDVILALKKYKVKERRNSMLEDQSLIGIFVVLYGLVDLNPDL